jgi:alcohol dehydrogenase, propanol-preferring
MTIPVFETVLNGTNIVGSIVSTRVDLQEVFELHAAGHTEVVYEKRRLEQVNDAIGEVLEGDVPARLVFDLAA